MPDRQSAEFHTPVLYVLLIHEQGPHVAVEQQEECPEAWREGSGAFLLLSSFHRTSEVQPREKGSKVMTPVLGKEQSHCGCGCVGVGG